MLLRRYTRIALTAATLAVVGIAALPPTGCGGGKKSEETAAPGRAVGTLELSIAWPETDTRVIPPPTDKIIITVTSIDGFFDDGKKSRVLIKQRVAGTTSPESLTFPGVPAGNVAVAVSANDVGGTTIARAASQIVRVQPGVNTSFSANLVVEQFPIPVVASLTITPGSILEGSTAEAEVTLSVPAPPQGSQVIITTESPFQAFLTAGGAGINSVTIPYKSTKGSFKIAASDGENTVTKNVTVTYNNSSKSAPIEVRRLLKEITVSPGTVVGANNFGASGNPPAVAQNVTGTVTLTERAPTNIIVRVREFSEEVGFGDGPQDNSVSSVIDVEVPQGQFSKSFPIYTDEIGLPSYPSAGSNAFNTYTQNITFYADRRGVNKSVNLKVTPRILPTGHEASGTGTCGNCHHSRAVKLPGNFAGSIMKSEQFK